MRSMEKSDAFFSIQVHILQGPIHLLKSQYKPLHITEAALTDEEYMCV